MAMFEGFRVWYLQSLDTGETLQGQFHPEELTESVGAAYAKHHALNRQKAILQFIHGEADTISFKGLFYAQDSTHRIQDMVEMLKSFCRRDDKLGRPPQVVFWVGDGHVTMRQCVVKTVAPITYGRPTADGGLREATFTVNLEEYEPFSLEETGIFETRYHVARAGDYYESLCYREYKDPKLGDVIRKRHPDKPIIQVGDVIKLPSIEAVRSVAVEPTSIALQTSYGKKATPQRALRQEMFNRRNRPYYSHVVKG